jgi:hypothetical protein
MFKYQIMKGFLMPSHRFLSYIVVFLHIKPIMVNISAAAAFGFCSWIKHLWPIGFLVSLQLSNLQYKTFRPINYRGIFLSFKFRGARP